MQVTTAERPKPDIVAAFERHVAGLDADQLAHLAAALQARAAERRKVITDEEAWTAYNAVPQITGWHWRGNQECGQIRKACEVLIGWQLLHPEQVIDAMTVVAEDVCIHPLVAREAVAAGCRDGLAYREGPQDDGD